MISENELFDMLDAHASPLGNLRLRHMGINQLKEISEYFCNEKDTQNPSVANLEAWSEKLYARYAVTLERRD